MDAHACLYAGTVMHQRLRPFRHRFAYRVFSLCVDLDRLPDAAALSPFFSAGRFNLLSFHEDDHLPGEARSLAERARHLLAAHGIDAGRGQIRLLCYPRVLGYAFNPLSVYFASDEAGVMVGVIYEVRNTFGERHTYVLPVAAGAQNRAIEQRAVKSFFVSPFLPMDLAYRFRLKPPGERVGVSILETGPEGPVMTAAFAGRRVGLSTMNILFLCARVPLMTLKVWAAIRWQALRILAKGARLQRRTRPAQAA
jgi:DUF1365 family protein